MEKPENAELLFPAKVHDMTANAEELIEVYLKTLATLKVAPEELEIPNLSEAIELTEKTLNTLMELKVAVKFLFEHASEMNDAVEKALEKLNKRKK